MEKKPPTKKLFWNLQRGGLANCFYSLELAIGFAKLTNRELYIHDKGGWASLNIASGLGGIQDRETTILDLFDLPVDVKISDDEMINSLEGSTYLYDKPISKSAMGVGGKESVGNEIPYDFFTRTIDSKDSDNSIIKDNFSENYLVGFRKVDGKIVGDGDQHGYQDALSYRNRFFYGDTEELFGFLDQIKPKKEYQELADKISSDLGRYNSVHFRVGDWSHFLSNGSTDFSRAEDLLDTIEKYGIDREKIVMCSNMTRNDNYLLSIIKDRFPNLINLEQHITVNYQDDINKLSKYTPNILALISLIVTSQSIDFWGCFGSTFTSLINRQKTNRDPSYKPKYHDMKNWSWFTNRSLPLDNEGGILNNRIGNFSWNGTFIEEKASWVVEFPTLHSIKPPKGKPTKVPKIIHQQGPADKNKWHPAWEHCQQTWKNIFPDYEYKLWTDEDLHDLVRSDFPEYLEMYEGYHLNICRIDIARPMILYKYGGIYADLDVLCNRDFYDQLPEGVSIVESSHHHEIFQNSMMMSDPGNEIWIDLLNHCYEEMMYSPKNDELLSLLRFERGEADDYIYNHEEVENPQEMISMRVRQLTGPISLSVLDNKITKLPHEQWNPNHGSPNWFSEDVYAKHVQTGKWADNSDMSDKTVEDIYEGQKRAYFPVIESKKKNKGVSNEV